jgi:hypothetical protein
MDDERSRASATAGALLAAKSSSATALNSKRRKRPWHSHALATVLAHRRRSASSTDSAQLCSPETTSSGLQTRVFLSRTPPASHSLLVATSSCLSPAFCFLDLFFFSTLISLPYPVLSLVCFLTSHARRWGREVKGQSSPQGQVGRGMPPESDSAVDSAQASAPRGRAHGLKPIGFQRERCQGRLKSGPLSPVEKWATW